MFKVEIKNLRIKAKIGVTAKERKKYQLLFVTIIFNYKVLNKANVNNIKFLKDYSLIIKFLKNFVANSRYKTLEKLITESKRILQKKFQLKSLSLKINKTSVAKKHKSDSISVEE